jgi:hypothetical protein
VMFLDAQPVAHQDDLRKRYLFLTHASTKLDLSLQGKCALDASRALVMLGSFDCTRIASLPGLLRSEVTARFLGPPKSEVRPLRSDFRSQTSDAYFFANSLRCRLYKK